MEGMTTTEQINKKVDEKSGFMDSTIQKAIKQAGLPKCDLCDQIIASGAMPYLSENGVGLNVCLKCVQKAIRVYIQANGKKF